MEKLEYYEQKIAEFNLEYYAEKKKLRNNLNKVRVKNRRASDGMIGVKQVHIE